MGGEPNSVFVVHICICLIAFAVRLFIVRGMIGLSIKKYLMEVCVKSGVVTVVATVLPLTLYFSMTNSLLSAIVVVSVSLGSVAVSAYAIGLTKSERVFVSDKIGQTLAKFK